MSQQHPITPPPELVEQWEQQFLERPTINGCFVQSYIATKAARWGADQELEACCELLPGLTDYIRAARRPKPPSLKEQALVVLMALEIDEPGYEGTYNTIRRALEQLPN